MKRLFLFLLFLFVALNCFGQFANTNGNKFPYTNGLNRQDVFIIGTPGVTNKNIAASNILNSLAAVTTPTFNISGSATTADSATSATYSTNVVIGGKVGGQTLKKVDASGSLGWVNGNNETNIVFFWDDSFSSGLWAKYFYGDGSFLTNVASAGRSTVSSLSTNLVSGANLTNINVWGWIVSKSGNGGDDVTITNNSGGVLQIDSTTDPFSFPTLLGEDILLRNLTGRGTLTVSNATVLGTVTAASFSGSGASLTSLNADNISSGTVGSSRGGAGTVNGVLKANGSGTVSAAAAADVYGLWSGTGTYLTRFGTNANSTGSPAGSDKNVQYNASGSFGGENALSYDASTDTLTGSNAFFQTITAPVFNVTTLNSTNFYIWNSGGTNYSALATVATANRTVTFPDASITVAATTDVSNATNGLAGAISSSTPGVNGRGLTNIQERFVAVITNSWGSQSIDASLGTFLRTNMSGNISLTGVANGSISNWNYQTLWLDANGATRTITVPTEWYVAGQFTNSTVASLTNGTVGELNVRWLAGIVTNATFTIYQ